MCENYNHNTLHNKLYVRFLKFDRVEVYLVSLTDSEHRKDIEVSQTSATSKQNTYM